MIYVPTIIDNINLSYCFVIFGREIDYDFDTQEIVINKDLYFDQYGKRGASDEQLRTYIENIYYVLMTRGIEGTYVYACNDGLRRYLDQYIECEV